MPCIDTFAPPLARARGWLGLALTALLGATLSGCGSRDDRGAASPSPSQTSGIVVVAPGPVETVAPSASAAAGRKPLPPPGVVRNWDEVRLQAAQRLVAANRDITYVGKVPDALLAIAVLEIELHADGSVRRIEVLRPPRQAGETLQIAADAVRRAAPFGNVAHLPKPWKFVETFLFDDDRKFKPRTLDH